MSTSLLSHLEAQLLSSTHSTSLQLRSWEGKLPRTLHIADTSVKSTRAPPHIMVTNLAYHWLAILLLRPLFKPGYSASTLPSDHSIEPERRTLTNTTLHTLREAAASQCPSSANQIVRLFNRYDATYGLRFSPITSPQIAYTAGQIHLVMYLNANTNSAKEKAKAMLLDSITILERIGVTWVSGKVTADILRKLMERKQATPAASSASRPTLQTKVTAYTPNLSTSADVSMSNRSKRVSIDINNS